MLVIWNDRVLNAWPMTREEIAHARRQLSFWGPVDVIEAELVSRRRKRRHGPFARRAPKVTT